MKFSLKLWKDEANQKLRTLDKHLKTTTLQGRSFAVYGAISALCLWPLLEMLQAGHRLPLMLTCSGNLLANQLQTWQGQVDNINEETVTLWIIERLEADPNFKVALDDVLDQLGALSAAQKHLDDSLRQTLREELGQLGSLERFKNAVESQTRAIAHGTKARAAIATTESVAISGNVKGNVVIHRPKPSKS